LALHKTADLSDNSFGLAVFIEKNLVFRKKILKLSRGNVKRLKRTLPFDLDDTFAICMTTNEWRRMTANARLGKSLLVGSL